MARKKLITSSDVRKLRVIGGKRGTRRIGRVRACVFHPTERRCVGFIVKRPDLLWMFRRPDLFVALDGFDLIDGRIVVRPQAETSGPAACRRLGISWDDCVLWEGMPMMTADETVIGAVGSVTFSIDTGEVESVVANNGATAKYLLGTLEVPGDMIKGFRRGKGARLSVKDDARDVSDGDEFLGAIVVSDDVWQLQPEGGWAEAAGEFTAKAAARVKEAAAKASPKVHEVTHAAGEAINEGAYAVGKQVAASKGMFSAFKEEYDKACHGDDSSLAVRERDDEAADATVKAAPADADEGASSRAGAAAVGDECGAAGPDEVGYDGDEGEGEEPPAPAKKAPKKVPAKKDNPGIGGMFAAFKEEYDKARK